ncbi:MAG: LD-carboxypeptidase [Bacteroidota bacterium]|nr:LD-carboxypeptidase [Bacteroidota bacterium]
MQTPGYLKKGDQVMIVAPARKISREEVKAARKILESWYLKVEYGPYLFREYHQFAGSDKERLEDFQVALDDPDIKAIICARGGYGSVRIIDQLDFTRFFKNPKWIVGYSDITVFHSHINRHYGIETLHAEMPLNFGKEKTKEETLTSLKDALFGNLKTYTLPYTVNNRQGHAEGILTGGNLSMLYSLMGSPSDINTENKILFIEDLDEYLYHVDRMMMNLKRSGKLDRLAGLIVGGLSDMNDNSIAFGKTANEIVQEHIEEYDYPVCFDFPAGHVPDNRALIMGREVSLSVDWGGVLLGF